MCEFNIKNIRTERELQSSHFEPNSNKPKLFDDVRTRTELEPNGSRTRTGLEPNGSRTRTGLEPNGSRTRTGLEPTGGRTEPN